ncbi:protein kinase domain-containing protein [Archangium lansingense]|uniref:Protein kinase n=1 Tax=Archangium lansingense TaxID=2995310 RepID=A0ABT4AL27_9BACT|nr:protein kinase [Archangium lansinium]MCY1081859.1 protein kinase [Archangium lansinium]
MIDTGTLVLDGRFRVLQLLGAGGMGEVYLGEQVSLGRRVAIKVLHADLMVHPSMIERFKREARMLSAVEHPAVVHVIDYGQAEVGACLVMEYVEGENLYDVLQLGAMAPSRALPLLYQLAEGLAAIHDKGIIHRDLKPENVLLTKGLRGEQARLLDFGIARLVEPDASSSNLSQVGLVVGTPEYLSPEQAVGAPVDTRSDLYSFGVLAYRMLSGQLPFPGPGPTQYVAQHAAATPMPLIEAAPTLVGHPTLVSLVMQLLQKAPTHRLPSATALVDALGALAAAGAQGMVGVPVAMAVGAASPSISAFLVPDASDPVGSGTAPFSVLQEKPAESPSSGTAVFGPPPPVAAPVAAPVPAPVAAPAPAPASNGRASSQAPTLQARHMALPEGASSPSRAPTRPSQSAVAAVVYEKHVARAGTVVPAPKPAGTVAPIGSGTLSGSKPQNLTVMLTDLQGFTERTSRQTHEQNARMLETHDGLLLPLVRQYGGRVVQKRGDSLLVVFTSPTHSVLCGMAMQDRLWRHNQTCGPDEQLPVRICLHTGEVLVSRDAVLGEPVEVVKAVEQVAEAGEVVFTESVNLARNRVEGDAEPCGSVPMPGNGEPLRLHRCRRAPEGLPFGGQDEVSLSPPIEEQLGPVMRPARAVADLARTLAERAVTLAKAYPRQTLGGALGLVAVLSLGTLEMARRAEPEYQARELLEAGKPADALKRLAEVPADAKKNAPMLEVRAQALHALERHEEEHTVLATLAAEPRESIAEPVLDGLASDFGEDEADKGLRKLLSSLPKEPVKKRFEELAEEEPSARQWGALRYLEAVQSTDGLDLVKLYTRSLESKNCGVRARSARRLAGLGDPEAVPALEQLSKLPKEKAVVGSKNCGQDEAKDALETLSKK